MLPKLLFLFLLSTIILAQPNVSTKRPIDVSGYNKIKWGATTQEIKKFLISSSKTFKITNDEITDSIRLTFTNPYADIKMERRFLFYHDSLKAVIMLYRYFIDNDNDDDEDHYDEAFDTFVREMTTKYGNSDTSWSEENGIQHDRISMWDFNSTTIGIDKNYERIKIPRPSRKYMRHVRIGYWSRYFERRIAMDDSLATKRDF